MTLYIDKADKARVSNCTGACAVTWPPYTVPSSIAANLVGSTPGITGSVGTIKRANGAIQVTYNNLPLYFYSRDKLVGDAKGQNIGGFVIVNL
jgi:predicted lipoprotein with Yx(FWY)xxD motif